MFIYDDNKHQKGEKVKKNKDLVGIGLATRPYPKVVNVKKSKEMPKQLPLDSVSDQNAK